MNNGILLANLYIIASYFTSGVVSIILLIFAFLWSLISLFEWRLERSIDKLDYLNHKINYMQQQEILLELKKLNKKKK